MSRDQRVKTAWSDLDHVRLVYDVEERASHRAAERLRGTPPDDPWAAAGDAP